MILAFIREVFDRLTLPIRLIASQPMRLFTAPARLFGISLPVRLAIFTFLFLLLCVAVGFFLYYRMPERAEVSATWDFKRIATVSVLLIVIPVLVHQLMQMWLKGESSRYPDIDAAWAEGLRTLKQSGIALTDVPLFLVVGTGDEGQTRSLMRASDRNFSIKGFPEGSGPLHWYVDDTGVFLVLTGMTQVGVLTTMTPNFSMSSSGVATPAGAGAGAPAGYGSTMTAGSDGSSSMMMPLGEDSTIVPNYGAPPPPPPPSGGGGYTSTLDPSALGGGSDSSFAIPTSSAPRLTAKVEMIAKIPDKKKQETRDRLNHVLKLIAQERQPYCPINGILSYVPFKLVLAGNAQSVELQQAIADDMLRLRDALRLRAPVSVMVAGMESDIGFQALIRRLGREVVKTNRFGKGIDPWNVPTEDSIEAVARHCCGQIEQWVYHLFASDGLRNTDNGKLYSILCLVRTELQDRLTNLLCAGYGPPAKPTGYGRDQDDSENLELMLFGGCYFAATGSHEDKQAFVKSLFDKVVEQEEQLSWTREALIENDRYQTWARFAYTLNIGLALTLGAFVLARPLGYEAQIRNLLPGVSKTPALNSDDDQAAEP